MTGDKVEWLNAFGQVERGEVERVDAAGRIFVGITRTNTKGRRRTKKTTVWFESNEVERLRVVQP